MSQKIKPPNAVSRLTVRSILTGMLIGGILTPCNIYSGLKIGWSFNMSIIAALLAYSLWSSLSYLLGTRALTRDENVCNQTAASAAASIVSGGLVAPIPAYTLITGQELGYSVLTIWVFAVSFLGILVAVSLRQQMLINEKLPFPTGVAAAQTIKDLHAKGGEAFNKVIVLLSLIGGAFVLKLLNDLVFVFKPISFLFFLPAKIFSSPLLSLKKLGIMIDPSFMMFGFGMIMGIRSAFSLLLGALIGWWVLPPFLVEHQMVTLENTDSALFSQLVTWTLWPGVGLMVVASITSFAMSLYDNIFKREQTAENSSDGIVKSRAFLLTSAVTLIVLVILQMMVFDIHPVIGALAVCASFLLGIVASRVSGETGIPPIGALGKVTQLTFGLANPGNVAANLMTANVTGGAAGQSSDLLHDLKTGLLLKVSPRHQIISQSFGLIVGSLVGCLVYMIIIPDPQKLLLTTEWPAPAVATWKSVAELMMKGASHFPPGATEALVIASVLGFAVAVAEKKLPEKFSVMLPSPAAMGLAFIIPAWTSITMFLGALSIYLVGKKYPDWTQKFGLVVAAGFVAGESLGGVFSTVLRIILPGF